MNVKKIIAGILTFTTAFSISAFYNTQATISAETYYIVGDANEDDKLNVRDAAFIASALSKGKSNELPVSADYNQDNSINVRDAAGIARYCAESYNSDVPVTTGVITEPTVETTTTTTVSTENGITTNTQSVETTAVIPTTTTTVTTTNSSNASTSVEITEAPNTTTTYTITTITAEHKHVYIAETEIVEHEAEYQTKTIWECMPEYYAGNQWMEDANVRASDRYVPESGLGWYSRITNYDLITWYYGDGTWDSITKYKDLAPWDDINSEFYIDSEYFKGSEFFTSYIDKNNFTEYGLTEEQWYDVNYMQKQMLPAGTDILGRDITGKIGVYDRWGNILPTFNPELDVLINFNYKTIHQPIEAEDGLDSKESNFETIVNKYMPVAQETILVEDAWTEIVTHEVCECGHVKE